MGETTRDQTVPAAPEMLVLERLRALGIPFERYAHPPLATAEQGREHWEGIEAAHCKNLFLRNQKDTRHYLVIAEFTKRVDLRLVASQIGDGKLSFASPDRLMTYLGVTPGSVSPFGLIHDIGHHVSVFVDRELARVNRISFHPNVNTATLTLAYRDFLRFLADCGHQIVYVDVQPDAGRRTAGRRGDGGASP